MKKQITNEVQEGKLTKTKQREIEKLAGQEELTVGIDIGDRNSRYCVLDAKAKIVSEGKLVTTKTGFESLFKTLAKTRVALEVGTHSLWISRHLSSLGHEVIVANPRPLKLISETKRKNDRIDAEKLARLARLDPKLLAPIKHRAENTQKDLVIIRSRAKLVKLRTGAINSARGLAKSLGHRLAHCDADNVGTHLADSLPADARKGVDSQLQAAANLTTQIKELDADIHKMAERYPEIKLLDVIYGVGELTALAFVLTMEDKERFDKSRDVGAYLELVPGEDQSGNSNPQQPITKEGDRMVRWMLVQCAHCILRKGAPDSDLKLWGEKKMDEQRTGKRQAESEESVGGSGAQAGGGDASVVGQRGSVRSAVQHQEAGGAGKESSGVRKSVGKWPTPRTPKSG